MRKLLSVIAAISFLNFTQASSLNAQPNAPDWLRAYELAAASYCAYAVTQLDPKDNGAKRALRCLGAAGKDDKALGDAIGEISDVEAYIDPQAPENAYLLARIKDGVILAFRGTITPPVDPKGNLFSASVDSVKKYNQQMATGFRTFIVDWLNNAKAGASQGRHSGFEQAWQRLLAHLTKECSTGAAIATDCSKLPTLIAGLNAAKGERLYITGHSKGGAMATLASLDLAKRFSVSPATYTYSSAKALTTQAATTTAILPGSFWRFERVDDIVPTLAPDSSFLPWHALGFQTYSHVGQLALFDGAASPKFPKPDASGFIQPDDGARIVNILTGASASPINVLRDAISSRDPIKMLMGVFSAGEKGCRRFVDSHFAIFADVRSQAPNANTSAKLFAKRIGDDGGDILWGYENWCDLLKFGE